MSRDHVAVGELTEKLGRLVSQIHAPEIPQTLMAELRRVLYGLYTLLWVHFAKEQEIYVPILDDALTLEAAVGFFAEMKPKALADR